ncbi:MAG: class I SAM-dependent methyltransferase [Planctomycetota bacterium]
MNLIDRVLLWAVRRVVRWKRYRHTDKCPTRAYQRVEHNGVVLLDGARDVLERFALFDLPQDLRGYQVLDVGCNLGAMCLEFKRRGASRVVGIDVDPNILRCARILARICRLDVEYYAAPLENMEEIPALAQARFDIVAMMSVWWHVKDKEKARGVLERRLADILLLEEIKRGDAPDVSSGRGFLQGRLLGVSDRDERRVFEFRKQSPSVLRVKGRAYSIEKEWRMPWALSQRLVDRRRVYYKLRLGARTYFAKKTTDMEPRDIERVEREFAFLQSRATQYPHLLLPVYALEAQGDTVVWLGEYLESVDLETYIRQTPRPPSRCASPGSTRSPSFSATSWPRA